MYKFCISYKVVWQLPRTWVWVKFSQKVVRRRVYNRRQTITRKWYSLSTHARGSVIHFNMEEPCGSGGHFQSLPTRSVCSAEGAHVRFLNKWRDAISSYFAWNPADTGPTRSAGTPKLSSPLPNYWPEVVIKCVVLKVNLLSVLGRKRVFAVVKRMQKCGLL